MTEKNVDQERQNAERDEKRQKEQAEQMRQQWEKGREQREEIGCREKFMTRKEIQYTEGER